MADVKQIIDQLFAANNITVPKSRAFLLDDFLKDEQNLSNVRAIIENQNLLMDK